MPRGPKLYLKSSLRPKVDKSSKEYRVLIEAALQEFKILEKLKNEILKQEIKRLSKMNKTMELRIQSNELRQQIDDLDYESRMSKIKYKKEIFLHLGEIESNEKIALEHVYPDTLPKPRNIWE